MLHFLMKKLSFARLISDATWPSFPSPSCFGLITTTAALARRAATSIRRPRHLARRKLGAPRLGRHLAYHPRAVDDEAVPDEGVEGRRHEREGRARLRKADGGDAALRKRR